MKTIKINTPKEAIDLMPKIQYSKNFVVYTSNEAQEQMLRNLEIVNEILGANAIEELPAKTEDFEPELIPGVYNIFFRVRGVQIPDLSDIDWNVRDLVLDAKNGKKTTIYAIDSRLFKFCKKIALQNGLKFKVTTDGCYFSNTKGRESVFDKISNAFKNNDESISFSLTEYNINTIRQYSSNLGLIHNRKFPCNIEGGKMTIYFRELSKEDRFKKTLLKVISEHSEYLTENTMRIILNSILQDEDNYDDDEVSVEEITTGDDWSDIEEQVRLKDLELEKNNNNYIDPDDF